MTEQECLAKMVAPGQVRPNKPFHGGVIQVCVTSICDLACFNCTQASQLENGDRGTMTPEQFEQAVESLAGYWGVLGVFGGNPATSKHFVEYCKILQRKWPQERAGLWCNNPINVEKGTAMRATFNPRVSNLNCHGHRHDSLTMGPADKCAVCGYAQRSYRNFKQWWPESMPFGLDKDSRHSPPFVAMRDVLKRRGRVCDSCQGNMGWYTAPEGWNNQEGDTYLSIPEGESGWPWMRCDECDGTGYEEAYDEEKAWELISGCDINQNWSALVGLFRRELRAWFCEVAGAQAMLHQHEPDYPDTGIDPTKTYDLPVGLWWEQSMYSPKFVEQVRKHCHECGVPLRGYGELAQATKGCEQTSKTHAGVYFPKRRDRPVQVVERLEQIGVGRLATGMVTRYLQNS